MCSGAGHSNVLVRGSPIRTSSDQRSVGSSPRLLAASHVLHRLLVPRHPPCALNNLATQKPHPSTTPRKGPASGRAYKNSLQSQKMLASTVQFSTYDQPPPRTAPPDPTPNACGRYENRNGPVRSRIARSLRTQQRA